jgi:protein tyrosine phosphatase (PTP) superfamily phosphohydrolase (DUF442 family)
MGAMPIEDIKNFLRIDDRVGTAGQPSEDQLREVAAGGYACVVNLGLLDPKYCLPDEAGLAAALGLAYRHIPVKFDAPAPEDFAAFVAAMDTWAGKRVFVHCAANYRVSSFMALYGELRLGWTRAQADAHARALWQPNETWLRFLEDCRARFSGR